MYETVFRLEARLFKALANSRRLEIMHLLRDQTLPVTDIYSMLDLPQANISQHLMVLRQAGAVSTQRQGKQVLYAVTDSRLIAVCDTLRSLVLEQHQDEPWAQGYRNTNNTAEPVHHDPVCGMRVTAHTAGAHSSYQGTTYYFCASGCYQQFVEQPQSFLSNQYVNNNTT